MSSRDFCLFLNYDWHQIFPAPNCINNVQINKMNSTGGHFVASDSQVILVSPAPAQKEKAMASDIDAEEQFRLPLRTTGHLPFSLRELKSEKKSAWFVLC